jgi:anti-sigma B factor antagonist
VPYGPGDRSVVDDGLLPAGGPGLLIYAAHDGDGVAVRLWGDLDAASVADLDRELLRIAHGLAQGERVVVDSCSLTFIDSSGIAALLRGRAAVHRHGGRFRLVTSEALRRLLELTGADALLVDG